MGTTTEHERDAERMRADVERVRALAVALQAQFPEDGWISPDLAVSTVGLIISHLNHVLRSE